MWSDTWSLNSEGRKAVHVWQWSSEEVTKEWIKLHYDGLKSSMNETVDQLT
jgi:hypothetical protein